MEAGIFFKDSQMREGIGGAALPMDVARQKRGKLEDEIAALLFKFRDETGCDLSSIELRYGVSMGETKITGVCVEVAL